MFISPAHPVLTQQQCDTTLLFYEVQGASIKITVQVYQIDIKHMRFFFLPDVALQSDKVYRLFGRDNH